MTCSIKNGEQKYCESWHRVQLDHMYDTRKSDS